MATKWIYFFGYGDAEGDPKRKDILGGKGAGLADMCRASLPVPPGFTISTECCKLFLDSGGTWPEGLEAEVRQYLERLEQVAGRKFGDIAAPLLVSVRSGAAASMPGMMDTILNCGLAPWMASHYPQPEFFWRVYAQFVVMFGKTVAAIPAAEFDAIEQDLRSRAPHAGHGHAKHGHAEDQAPPTLHVDLVPRYLDLYQRHAGRPFPTEPYDALIQCIEAVFRSWNNERAITYRREHDIRGLIGTAVNVQSMFPSQVSGIVFTANPNNLEADEMIIEAAFGLGEAVVSGDVHPDNFAIDRKTLAVKRATIGHKAHAVSALGDTARHAPDDPSLTNDQLGELAGMSRQVEKFFGRPMDIEFGWADGKFALLQARAIRGLEIAEDVLLGRNEEMHRLRQLAPDKRKVWVRYNLAETLPAPTPMTWDIIREFMSGSGGFGRLYRDLGYTPSPRVCEEGFLELICGRIYADPERMAQLFYAQAPLAYDLEQVIQDPKVMDSAPTKFIPEQADAKFLLNLPKLIRQTLRSSKLQKQARAQALPRFQRLLPEYLEWVRQKRAMDLTALATPQVIQEFEGRCRYVLNEFGGESLKPGFFGGGAQASLQATLCQLMGEQAGRELALALTQGLDGDSTIEQNEAMFQVARGSKTLQQFLDEYGHRAVEEMELSRPRWREDSSYIRQTMGGFLDPNVASPHQRHRQNAARCKEAQAKLPAVLREWGGSSLAEDIQQDLADAQKLLPYRETGKFYLMMGYEAIRLALLELSRRWNLGRDIFFLQRDELGVFEAQRQELTQRIAARKVRWQSARRLEMGEVIDTAALDELGLPKKYDAASELKGEPVAPGVATSVARIVKDPSQTADLCQEYILVCHSTDPGWTALFVRARGLIVEQGGVLSHGAIVARDFGIPAVVCPDATKRIPDNSLVRVDGNRGLVTIIPKDN